MDDSPAAVQKRDPVSKQDLNTEGKECTGMPGCRQNVRQMPDGTCGNTQ